VDSLTNEKVAACAQTGKAYLHTAKDTQGRSVVVVVAGKHFPNVSLLISERFVGMFCKIYNFLQLVIPQISRIPDHQPSVWEVSISGGAAEFFQWRHLFALLHKPLPGSLFSMLTNSFLCANQLIPPC
jgi:hypothetical protein